MIRLHPVVRWALGFAGIGLFLTALCTIPYKFAPAPSVSESYYFGYSNRAGEIVIAVGVMLVMLFGPAVRPSQSTGKRLTRSLLVWWLGATLLLAAALQIFARHMDGFGEGIYLVDRVKLAFAGLRPYLDFEYPYGALFLYGPVWIARLLHLTPGDGYAIFWTLNCFAGVWLLYLTLIWIDIPQGKQRAVFIFFSSYGLLMMGAGGVNYTLFRYMVSPFFAVMLYRRAKKRAGSTDPGWPMLLAVPCAAFLMLISPELAISFGVGVAIYFALWGRLFVRWNLLSYTGMLAGLIAVGWFANRLGVFYTMKTFSTGAYNLPIVPGPHILLFFAALTLSASYVARSFRGHTADALVMLICTSAAGIAGALGRCDPVHTLMNALGLVLAAALLRTAYGWFDRVWWWAVWLVYFWIFVPGAIAGLGTNFSKIAMQAYLAGGNSAHPHGLERWIENRMTVALGPEGARTKLAEMQAYVAARNTLDVNRTLGLAPGTVSEAPFGFSPSRFGTFQTPEIDEGYYFEHENIGTPAAVERKIGEMRIHPERPLLLLPDREISCGLSPEAQRSFLRQVFHVPYRAPVRNPTSVTEPLCAFIRENYHEAQQPVPEHFGYALWQHK